MATILINSPKIKKACNKAIQKLINEYSPRINEAQEKLNYIASCNKFVRIYYWYVSYVWCERIKKWTKDYNARKQPYETMLLMATKAPYLILDEADFYYLKDWL